MTFIRMADGRDRGRVLDIPFLEAEEMLEKGQAIAVDLSQPGAMEFQEVQPPVVSGQLPVKPEPAVLGDVVLAEAVPEPTRATKPAGGFPFRKRGR